MSQHWFRDEVMAKMREDAECLLEDKAEKKIDPEVLGKRCAIRCLKLLDILEELQLPQGLRLCLSYPRPEQIRLARYGLLGDTRLQRLRYPTEWTIRGVDLQVVRADTTRTKKTFQGVYADNLPADYEEWLEGEIKPEAQR